VKAYLVDPDARVIKSIELPDLGMLDAMARIIGSLSGGMDHQMISDEHDSIWVDEFGLQRGEPIYAFKLPIQRDPYAGRAIVIGADDAGRTRPPFVPLWLLLRDLEWLGLIVPTIDWVEEGNRTRAIVTYSRPKIE
jgi:hypothetical protein